MEYVHVITDNSVMVVDTSNGETVKYFSDDERYEKALELIRQGDIGSVFNLDVKHVVTSFMMESGDCTVSIKVEDGEGFVVLHEHGSMKVPLQSAITRRILKMNEQGFSSAPLINFISNLYKNPSATAIAELYLFIEAAELPITEDGCFIAYKIVLDDYMDIYSQSVSNKIGETPSMPRHMVDDNRHNTCSRGLHFCSKSYLSSYGSASRSTDRCMLVKINPADVVSIPSDYNNAKGRTWMYEVVGEVEGQWRDWLPSTDFTSSAVYESDDEDIEEYDEVPPCEPFSEDEVPVSEHFIKGYKDGYSDGRKHEPFDTVRIPHTEQRYIDYDEGFDLGYKHGYGHRTKLYK